MDLANQLVNYWKTNDPKAAEYEWKLKFLTMYEDKLCEWYLETYQADEDNYTKNCLKPSEMQCLSQFANKILGLSFCIDFYLTPTT